MGKLSHTCNIGMVWMVVYPHLSLPAQSDDRLIPLIWCLLAIIDGWMDNVHYGRCWMYGAYVCICFVMLRYSCVVQVSCPLPPASNHGVATYLGRELLFICGILDCRKALFYWILRLISSTKTRSMVSWKLACIVRLELPRLFNLDPCYPFISSRAHIERCIRDVRAMRARIYL